MSTTENETFLGEVEQVLRVGVGVWMPCRVRRGPFPDERMVLVRWEGSEWSGFVNAEWLRHRVEEGHGSRRRAFHGHHAGQFIWFVDCGGLRRPMGAGR